MSHKVYTLKQKPGLRSQIGLLNVEAWPEFLLHGNVHHWHSLFEAFADCQILLCEPGSRVIALGHTVPLVWDGALENLPSSVDEIIVRALRIQENQQLPNTLCALSVIVAPSHQGQGLSSEILRAMKLLAAEQNCQALIVPVHPAWKNRYPLIPMEKYVRWVRVDGAPFDPWLRVHWQLGAEWLKVAPSMLRVTGTVAEWESWTRMQFPESGQYIVPAALQPITIDRERNMGYYEDPNMWVKYSIAAQRLTQ